MHTEHDGVALFQVALEKQKEGGQIGWEYVDRPFRARC
jgi:hypothetical protein